MPTTVLRTARKLIINLKKKKLKDIKLGGGTQSGPEAVRERIKNGDDKNTL